MGLASALSTSLTGLIAAETTIDVVGNNLANSQTVGFKASSVSFATQFLQTRSLGSSPTANNGGVNPRQVGLGVQVAEITPDFTKGTIEISNNPSDLAIQGDGMFIVEGAGGQRFYTRNGGFKTNSENQLVTTGGERVLGYGIDDQFRLDTTKVEPLSIPLGAAAVAEATKNVYLEGTLTPQGNVADTATVIQSAILGDAAYPRPDSSGTSIGTTPVPLAGGINVTQTDGTAGTHPENVTYRYKVTYTDSYGFESIPSEEIVVRTPIGNGAADNTISLANLPNSGGNATQMTIYRTAADGSTFYKLDTVPAGSTYTDNNSKALTSTPLDNTTLTGNYTYLVTYYKAGQVESRPSVEIGPVNVVNGRVSLSDLPTPPTPGPQDKFPAYDEIRIYRNLATDANSYYLVGTVPPGSDFIDDRTDQQISDLSVPGNKQVDLDGPRISSNTLLTDVLRRDGLTFEPAYNLGTMSFTARKGGRALDTKDFTVASTSTVQNLLDFMEDATGLQTTLDDPTHPLPGSKNNIPGESGTLPPGASIVNGQIRFVSNTGVDNGVSIGLSSFTLRDNAGNVQTPNLGFGTIQEGKGQSAVTDFITYDSLGIEVPVRLTMVLESRTGSSTTYRWFADSPGNDGVSPADISVGTGLVTFDGEGKFIAATNSTVNIERRNVPSASPLEFRLDFNQMSGLASDKASVAASRQDGSPPGTLSSYIIGEDGVIRGVFTSGVTRDLGQIQLARFANPAGLEQVGQNLFRAGVNSGLPVQGAPGENGIGKVVSGARELSNTDIGENLVDLVLASTQYRGNTRVITTAQQLLDELLNLRR